MGLRMFRDGLMMHLMHHVEIHECSIELHRADFTKGLMEFVARFFLCEFRVVRDPSSVCIQSLFAFLMVQCFSVALEKVIGAPSRLHNIMVIRPSQNDLH